MAELPDDDPRMLEFNNTLLALLSKFVGKEMNDSTFDSLKYQVNQERTRFTLQYGCDLPQLVILPLPTSRHIGLFRADLESSQIQIVVLNMLREISVRNIPIDRRELAIAIHRAWPYYDPSLAIGMSDVDRQTKPSMRN